MASATDNNITPNGDGDNEVFIDDGTCDWQEYFKMTTAMIQLRSNDEDNDGGGGFDMYYISHYIVAGVAVLGVIVMMMILIGSQLRHRRHVENENRSSGYDDSNNASSKPSVKVTPPKTVKRIETIEDLEEFDDKTVITRGFFFTRNRSTNNTNNYENNHGSDNKSRASTHRPPKPIDVNVFLLVVATSWYLFWFAISHFMRALYFDSFQNDGDLSGMKWMVRLYHVALLFSLPGLMLIAYELEFQYSFRQMSTENGDSASVISNLKKDKKNNKKVFHFLIYVTFVLLGVTIGSILPLVNIGDDMFFTGLIVSSVYVFVTLTSLMMVTYRIFYHSCGVVIAITQPKCQLSHPRKIIYYLHYVWYCFSSVRCL